MEIEPEIIERIKFVAKYIEDSSNDWLRIKKEIVNNLPIQYRSKFSRRHKTSKKQIINDFEVEIIKLWKEITGIEVYIDPIYIHQLEDERPPRYWGIKKYNEERRLKKVTPKQT